MRDITAETFVLPIPGVALYELPIHTDDRGSLVEVWRESCFACRQANVTRSYRNALRGMHFHLRQTDYWRVDFGTIEVFLRDLRPDPPGPLASCYLFAPYLTSQVQRLLRIPPGVAHGFHARTDATLCYMVTEEYDAGADEYAVSFGDEYLRRGLPPPIVSERDRRAPPLEALPSDLLARVRALGGEVCRG